MRGVQRDPIDRSSDPDRRFRTLQTAKVVRQRPNSPAWEDVTSHSLLGIAERLTTDERRTAGLSPDGCKAGALSPILWWDSASSACDGTLTEGFGPFAVN